MVRVAESGATGIELEPCLCQRFADFMLKFACRHDEVSHALVVSSTQHSRQFNRQSSFLHFIHQPGDIHLIHPPLP